MLAGVGGMTVAEAKSRMSYREAQQWASFIKQNGPINSTRRIEAMLAKICWVVQRVQGGKMEADDFMPDYTEQEPQEASIEQFAAILSMARVK